MLSFFNWVTLPLFWNFFFVVIFYWKRLFAVLLLWTVPALSVSSIGVSYLSFQKFFLCLCFFTPPHLKLALEPLSSFPYLFPLTVSVICATSKAEGSSIHPFILCTLSLSLCPWPTAGYYFIYHTLWLTPPLFSAPLGKLVQNQWKSPSAALIDI